jgi:hypothetical protein
MKKLLLKLLGKYLYQPGRIERKKIQDWLYISYQNDGFKNYYTMRKKSLFNLMMSDLSKKDRDETRGRYKELQMMCTNMNTEAKLRKKKDK